MLAYTFTNHVIKLCESWTVPLKQISHYLNLHLLDLNEVRLSSFTFISCFYFFICKSLVFLLCLFFYLDAFLLLKNKSSRNMYSCDYSAFQTLCVPVIPVAFIFKPNGKINLWQKGVLSLKLFNAYNVWLSLLL